MAGARRGDPRDASTRPRLIRPRDSVGMLHCGINSRIVGRLTLGDRRVSMQVGSAAV